MDWFPYDEDLRHERVNLEFSVILKLGWISKSSTNLLVQSQQLNHKKKRSNAFKVNNKIPE